VNYQVTLARSARKELEELPKKTQARILEALKVLQEESRPSGCIKLRGNTGLWRIRSGQYRIIYSIEDKNRLIDISVIRHRSDAYR